MKVKNKETKDVNWAKKKNYLTLLKLHFQLWL